MRIRLGLSALNAQRRKYNFINYSTCPFCQADHEDEIHFFILCTQYAVQRQLMLVQLTQLIPHLYEIVNNLHVHKSRKKLVDIILKGTGQEITDVQLFEIVANFISASKRFLHE